MSELLSQYLEESLAPRVVKIDKNTKRKKKPNSKKKAVSSNDVTFSQFLEEECIDLKDKIRMIYPDGTWIKDVDGALEKADPEVQINNTLLKNRILSKFCKYTEPDAFYQNLFHYSTEGRFLTKVVLKDAPKKKPVIRQLGEKTIEVKTGTYDDVDCGSNSFARYRERMDAYVPPIKFFNTIQKDGVTVQKDYIHCCRETIEKIFAFVAYVDCSMSYFLYDFLRHNWHNPLNNKSIPKPTYIVNSGNGLHLYYCLDVPERVYKFNVKEMEELLNQIQEVCSTKGGGFLSNKKTQPFSLTQPFRVIGSKSKRGVTVNAFAYGDVWSLESLCEAFG